MELPALFYGRYRDVKRRTAKIVTQVRKGNDWMALVEAEGFLDTDTTPGFLVMDGPSNLLGGEAHFQVWLLWTQIYFAEPRVNDEIREEVFQRSLTRPWSTLGLVAYRGQDWLFQKYRYRPFLRAVRKYWDLFAAVGQRYTGGSRAPDDLWSLPNSIHYVLANLGMSNAEMDPPWPPGGLAELIDRTERHLH